MNEILICAAFVSGFLCRFGYERLCRRIAIYRTDRDRYVNSVRVVGFDTIPKQPIQAADWAAGGSSSFERFKPFDYRGDGQ